MTDRARLTVERVEQIREYALAGKVDTILVQEQECVALCDHALAALRREPAATEGAGWQPIETAPKDGRAIQLVSGNWQTTGSWHKAYQCWTTNGPVYSKYPADEQPTHWMPLPAPPAKHPSGGEK